MNDGEKERIEKEKVSLDEVQNLQKNYYKDQQIDDNESLDELNIATIENTNQEFILKLTKTDSNNATMEFDV